MSLTNTALHLCTKTFLPVETDGACIRQQLLHLLLVVVSVNTMAKEIALKKISRWNQEVKERLDAIKPAYIKPELLMSCQLNFTRNTPKYVRSIP